MAGQPSGGIGLLCDSCRVPHFPFGIQPLRQIRPGKAAFHLHLVLPAGRVEKPTAVGQHSTALDTFT